MVLDLTMKKSELVRRYAKKLNPDIEVDLIEGKQDIYSYIIAVE